MPTSAHAHSSSVGTLGSFAATNLSGRGASKSKHALPSLRAAGFGLGQGLMEGEEDANAALECLHPWPEYGADESLSLHEDLVDNDGNLLTHRPDPKSKGWAPPWGLAHYTYTPEGAGHLSDESGRGAPARASPGGAKGGVPLNVVHGALDTKKPAKKTPEIPQARSSVTPKHTPPTRDAGRHLHR